MAVELRIAGDGVSQRVAAAVGAAASAVVNVGKQAVPEAVQEVIQVIDEIQNAEVARDIWSQFVGVIAAVGAPAVETAWRLWREHARVHNVHGQVTEKLKDCDDPICEDFQFDMAQNDPGPYTPSYSSRGSRPPDGPRKSALPPLDDRPPGSRRQLFPPGVPMRQVRPSHSASEWDDALRNAFTEDPNDFRPRETAIPWKPRLRRKRFRRTGFGPSSARIVRSGPPVMGRYGVFR